MNDAPETKDQSGAPSPSERIERPEQLGNPEWVAKLGPNETVVWNIYQDFLYCIDASVVPPQNMAQVAAFLTLAVVTGMNAIPPGAHP